MISGNIQNELDRIINFEPLIRRSLQGFVGREWVMDAVADFLRQPGPRNLLLLGEPGSGKTSVMAALVDRYGCPHHFIGKGSQVDVEGSPEWRNPARFAESLGYQLVRDYGGWLMPWDQFGIVVEQDVQKLEGRLTGADIGVFRAMPRPSNAPAIAVHQTAKQLGRAAQVIGVQVKEMKMDVEQVVQLLLVEPLKRLARRWPGDQVVVVIDGLDEAEYSDPAHSIFRLLPGSELPDKVRLLLSSRRTEHLPQAFLQQTLPVWLSEDEEGQWRRDDALGDAAKYVESVIAKEDPVRKLLERRAVDPHQFADAAADASGGNFLYLYYLAKGLRSGDETLLDLTALPKGLTGIYSDFLAKIRGRVATSQSRAFDAILGTLAVAREPLPLQQVARFARVDEAKTKTILKRLTEFLDPYSAQRCRVYHRSFGEFLLSEHEVDAAEAHDRVVKAYLPARSQAPWESWDSYGWRYVPYHLSEAALRSSDPAEKHKRTERLAKLVLDRGFQESERDKLALLDALDLAVRTTAENGVREGLPLVVNTAREQVAVRRRLLNPDDVFAAADRGDVAEAEKRLSFFVLDQKSRQAARLVIAWLAVPVQVGDAHDLRDRVAAELQARSDPVLTHLLARVDAALDGKLPVLDPLDKPPPLVDIQAWIRRMAGMKDPEGNMRPKPSPQEMEGVGGYETTCRLITADAVAMAARASCDEDQQAPYIDDYLDVLARNTYVRYRNGFLLAFLDGLLRHPEQDWTLKRARAVSAAALAGNKLEFEQGLALAIQAIRAKAKATGAGAALDATIDRIRSQASQATYPNGDPWSMHLRNLAALGECLAGTDQHRDVASQCLTDAAHLWRGYAGFRAPACLTLAEVMRITGLPYPSHYETIALPEALGAAHNIQEAIFCAQTTSRVNAMLRQWKTIPAQDVQALIGRFSGDPTAAEFAPIHVVGEKYDRRDTVMEQTPLPEELRAARSLHDLAAYVYDRQPAELLRLNIARAQRDVMAPLSDDGSVEVCIPDPEFAPLLAARLAAEALAAPNLLPYERVALIRLLVPVAASNPTALDTVLMRLLLAASYWLNTATLRRLDGIPLDKLVSVGQTIGVVEGRMVGVVSGKAMGTEPFLVHQKLSPVTDAGASAGIELKDL